MSAIDADGVAAMATPPFGFAGHAGEVRIVAFGNEYRDVHLDTDGNRVSESIILAVADHALTAADFVL